MAKSSLPCILLVLFLVAVTCSACDNGTTTGFKGMFIFGDDVVDNGNNNGLLPLFVKGNYMPYGIDFKDGPTGRFTNGKTVVDFVADNLKLPYPPPVPDFFHQGTNILQGVNFGSSGTGILGITGSALVGIQHMDDQINKFKNNILPKLKEKLGCKGQTILPQYLFVIGTGNNDYYSYYILKQYLVVPPKAFAAKLVKNYLKYIQKLYNEGARKFLLISPYPIGCGPGLVKEKKGCIKFINDAVNLFHDQLLIMIKQSKNKDMPDAEITVLNSGKIIMDVVNKVTAAPDAGITKVGCAITNVDCACCKTDYKDVCKKGGQVCLNRKEYLYYDGMHLTEAANSYLASKAFSTSTNDVSPVNLQKLSGAA
ncbi:hypothetical protein BVRB_1g000630 [Beta vulgaris subsp. vulgaris]|nr:hypothetical protein BVRB_1g000630 [Beta vulgaris subsp. vulgaris]